MFTLIMSTKIILIIFNDSATSVIYTLSLHDALPIFLSGHRLSDPPVTAIVRKSIGKCAQALGVRQDSGAPDIGRDGLWYPGDRKSTRLNSSHVRISYAVFCLIKKNILIIVISTINNA